MISRDSLKHLSEGNVCQAPHLKVGSDVCGRSAVSPSLAVTTSRVPFGCVAYSSSRAQSEVLTTLPAIIHLARGPSAFQFLATNGVQWTSFAISLGWSSSVRQWEAKHSPGPGCVAAAGLRSLPPTVLVPPAWVSQAAAETEPATAATVARCGLACQTCSQHTTKPIVELHAHPAWTHPEVRSQIVPAIAGTC